MKVEVILIHLQDPKNRQNVEPIAPPPPISSRAIAVRSDESHTVHHLPFFQISQTEFALCRAECQTEDAASAALLNWTAEVIQAARNGLQVLV